MALGDSHLDVLQFAASLDLLDVENSYFSIVPGATAVGLRNPNSLTDALNIFRCSLSEQKKISHVLVHLGEVDCGFVIWWRAKKYGESIDVQLQASLNAYGVFLREIQQQYSVNLCVAGATLPTIRDGLDLSDVANKRSEIQVSLQLRTELTLRYNDALKAMAQQLGISYFDITDSVLNKSSHMIHDFFRHHDIYDHHLDQNKTVGIWAGQCNLFLAGGL